MIRFKSTVNFNIILCNKTTQVETNNDSLDHYCWKKGIGLPGGDIKNIAFTTVQACKEECARTEGCTAFTTLAGRYNKCYLKNKDHGAEGASARAISVRMSCIGNKYIDH